MTTNKLRQRTSWLVKHGLFTKFLGTTAYDLFTQIKKIITVDHRTMQMQHLRTPLAYVVEDLQPTCGTVCCIAGWIDHLTAKDGQLDMSRARLLGFDDDAVQGPLDKLFFSNPLIRASNQGTKPHAEEVAKMITDFQKEHKALLQSTVITGTPVAEGR